MTNNVLVLKYFHVKKEEKFFEVNDDMRSQLEHALSAFKDANSTVEGADIDLEADEVLNQSFLFRVFKALVDKVIKKAQKLSMKEKYQYQF